MSGRTPVADHDRRKSEVLDAIFEAVEHAPDSEAESASFEARGLEQVDVAAQVDRALPLISRSAWVALVGVALVIVAGLVYSAGVVQVSSVNAVGRAVAAPGIVVAVSPGDILMTEVLIADGDPVTPGQLLATGTSGQGNVIEVLAPAGGTVWQQLAFAGQSLLTGASVASILPIGSEQAALVAVPESSSAQVSVGLAVDSSVGTGTVTSVNSAPIPAVLASSLLGISIPDTEPVVLINVVLDAPVERGSNVIARIIVSEQTLLAQIMRLG